MPAVLKQVSVIIAVIAAAATGFAGVDAGVRAVELATRAGGTFLVFLAICLVIGRTLTYLIPDAWSGNRIQRPAEKTLGRRLDITLPASSPTGSAFIPLSGLDLAATDAAATKELVDRDPALAAGVVASMSQADQEG